MKKMTMCIAFFFCTMCLMTGCGEQTTDTSKLTINVYCFNDSDELVCEEHSFDKNTDTNILIDNVITAIQTDPVEYKDKKLLDNDVKINKYNLIDGKLMLFFDVAYSNYQGVDEVLRRAGIVKTLTQIDGVDGVEFYVDNRLLSISGEQTLGMMTSDSIIDNATGEASYMQNTTVSVYFANTAGNKLVEVPIKISYDATIPLEQLMIEQLIQGPANIEGISKKGVQDTMPKDTVLNSVTIKDNVCYVDFNEMFLTKMSHVKSEVTLYAVVNLLVELPTVNKVQFTINGESVATYGDNIPFDGQFERNLDIVQAKED